MPKFGYVLLCCTKICVVFMIFITLLFSFLILYCPVTSSEIADRGTRHEAIAFAMAEGPSKIDDRFQGNESLVEEKTYSVDYVTADFFSIKGYDVEIDHNSPFLIEINKKFNISIVGREELPGQSYRIYLKLIDPITQTENIYKTRIMNDTSFGRIVEAIENNRSLQQTSTSNAMIETTYYFWTLKIEYTLRLEDDTVYKVTLNATKRDEPYNFKKLQNWHDKIMFSPGDVVEIKDEISSISQYPQSKFIFNLKSLDVQFDKKDEDLLEMFGPSRQSKTYLENGDLYVLTGSNKFFETVYLTDKDGKTEKNYSLSLFGNSHIGLGDQLELIFTEPELVIENYPIKSYGTLMLYNIKFFKNYKGEIVIFCSDYYLVRE